MSSLSAALVLCLLGGAVVLRGGVVAPGSARTPATRGLGAASAATVSVGVGLLALAWLPAAAGSTGSATVVLGEAGADFGRNSAWTFALMLAPVAVVVAGMWRLGLFDFGAEPGLAPDRAPEGAEAQPRPKGATPTGSGPDPAPTAPTEQGPTPDDGPPPPTAADAAPQADDARADDPRPLEALVMGEPSTRDAAIAAASALLERRAVAVVLSHAETREVNELGLSLAREASASVYIIGEADHTRSPDFEREHAAEIDAGHEHELALAVAGGALEAVLFVDGRGEFSEFTLEMLARLDAACVAARSTAVTRRCKVIVPCAEDPELAPSGAGDGTRDTHEGAGEGGAESDAQEELPSRLEILEAMVRERASRRA